MAEVFGTIGNEQVELNNAATERTLQALLAVMKTDSKALLKMAEKAGVEMGNIEEFNESIDEGTQSVENFNRSQANLLAEQEERYSRLQQKLTSLGEVTDQLMQGTLKTSDVFKQIAGNVDNVFIKSLSASAAKLISIQEQNFEAYQKLSNVGAGFGGDLTALRSAAANSYLTLDQFSNIVVQNSQLLAMMGGTADQGIQNFAKVSNSLVKSDAGSYLMKMGYTTDQLNSGLATYLTLSGGRTKKDLQNTEAIAQASADYMQNLDGLSRLTGQSRDQLQQQMQEQSRNAAWQAKLQSMTEEERKKATIGMQNAMAVGGKGAVDAFQSRIMGLPPISKEAQLFTATMGRTNDQVMNFANNVSDNSKTVEDQNKGMLRATDAVQEDLSKFSLSQRNIMISQGGALGDVIGHAQGAANKFSTQTIEDREKALAKQKIEETQAAQMAEAMAGLKALGASLWTAFSPLISVITYVAAGVGQLASGLAKLVEKFPNISTTLVTLAGALSLYLVWKLKSMAVERASSLGSRVLNGISSPTPIQGPPGGQSGPGGAASGGLLSGFANGLKAFANPQVLLGAAGFAAAIAAIGAGIAAAAWLTGAALPKLAAGLESLQTLDGSKLLDASVGMGAVGLSMLTFAPIALFGIPAGLGLGMMADGLLKLNKVDTAHLLKVADAMEKVKAATPSVGESLKMGFSNIISKVTGGSTTETPAATSQNSNQSSDLNAMAAEMKRLNNVSTEMLKNIREIAENTKRNVDATKSLNGNLFATV